MPMGFGPIYRTYLKYSRDYVLTITDQSNMEREIIISGLRITFSVERSMESYPDRMTVNIYNLSKDTRKIIESSIFEQIRSPIDSIPSDYDIKFAAGYDGDFGILFSGNITTVTTRKIGPDIITTIEAADGFRLLTELALNLSYGPGTSAGQILADVIGIAQMTTPLILGFDANRKNLNGLVLSGGFKEAIDKIVTPQNLVWVIQNGRLLVLPDVPNAFFTLSGSSADESFRTLAVSRQSGLIGTPYRTIFTRTQKMPPNAAPAMGVEASLNISDAVQVAAPTPFAGVIDTGLSVNGIIFTSLLERDLLPGYAVFLDTYPDESNVDGYYKIEKVRHHGDTHGNPWYTEVVTL